MDIVKFAVIGAGHIGKRHAEMVRRNPHAELVAMSDIRKREECGVQDDVAFYQDAEQMLAAHPEIDVVCVCTPNGLHAQHSLVALNHNKHVVVEKPMGLSKVQCEKVLFTALNKSKQVFCVMQNRYSPPSIWIKDVVDRGILGEIFMVQINCFWNRDDRYYKKMNWKGRMDLDGGTLFTQFSHFVDIMFWLFGDITQINSRFMDFSHSQTTDFEDSGTVSFDFVDGGSGSLNFSTAVANQNFESSMTIIAEKGTVKIGGQYMNEVEYCNIEGYEMPELAEGNPANDYGAYKGSAANHVFVIENVIRSLRGEETITTNAMEGLKVVEIIERMYDAAHRPKKENSTKQELSN